MDATYRSDLRELNELNFARFDAKLEQHIAELRAEIRQELAGFRVEVAQRFADRVRRPGGDPSNPASSWS